MSHTPTPWYVSGFETQAGGNSRVIMGGDGFSIAHVMDRTTPENIADAAFIVKACNAHDELLIALAEVFSDHGKVNSLEWTDKAAQALAKAGAL